MISFNTATIEKVIDYLKEDYSLELEQDKDFLFYYIDVFQPENETEYFQFLISEEGLRIEGSECPDMIAQYTPDEFDSTVDVLKCIESELKYYLPIALLREYKIKKILED